MCALSALSSPMSQSEARPPQRQHTEAEARETLCTKTRSLVSLSGKGRRRRSGELLQLASREGDNSMGLRRRRMIGVGNSRTPNSSFSPHGFAFCLLLLLLLLHGPQGHHTRIRSRRRSKSWRSHNERHTQARLDLFCKAQ